MIFGLGLEKAGMNPATMKRALEIGVKFFDAAPMYCYGLCEENLATAIKESGVDRKSLTISTKTQHRRPEAALALLDKSLKYLKTDYIDIWSLHDLETMYDLMVMPALEEAKKSGKVKYIGITCNKNPANLKKALSAYHFDYVMMSMNVADRLYASFIDNVLPYVGDTKVIAMQVFMRGKSRYPISEYLDKVTNRTAHRCPKDGAEMVIWVTTGHPANGASLAGWWRCPKCGHREIDEKGYQMIANCINYVASYNPDIMLLGCNGVEQLDQDWALFNQAKNLSKEEMQQIEEIARPHTHMLNFYKAEEFNESELKFTSEGKKFNTIKGIFE